MTTENFFRELSFFQIKIAQTLLMTTLMGGCRNYPRIHFSPVLASQMTDHIWKDHLSQVQWI